MTASVAVSAVTPVAIARVVVATGASVAVRAAVRVLFPCVVVPAGARVAVRTAVRVLFPCLVVPTGTGVAVWVAAHMNVCAAIGRMFVLRRRAAARLCIFVRDDGGGLQVVLLFHC